MEFITGNSLVARVTIHTLNRVYIMIALYEAYDIYPWHGVYVYLWCGATCMLIQQRDVVGEVCISVPVLS